MSKFNAEELLEQLTAEEKIALLSGYDFWHTVPIPRLGIPSVRVSDGPVRVQGIFAIIIVLTRCIER